MMRFGRSLVLRRTRIIGLPVFLCRSIRRQVLSGFFFLYFGRKHAWMPSRFVFRKKEVALSFSLLACLVFYWAGEENGCHKMQMSRWWRFSSYILEWFGKSMQKFLIDMSWAFFLAVSCVWLYCLRLGIYIEMAGRSYPYLSVSVLEAVCGTFVICTLCKALEENEQIKHLMVFIGRHTLLIFSMHCLDWIAVDAWMNHRMWI